MEEQVLYKREKIEQEINSRSEQIEREIELITIRQTEIHSHIHNLQNVIDHFKSLIRTEKDANKRSKYHNIISHNIELLAKLYSVYREFEDTKNKFYKEHNTLLLSKIRIINIELEKIEQQIDDVNSFLLQIMNNSNDNAIKDLNDDELLKQQRYKI